MSIVNKGLTVTLLSASRGARSAMCGVSTLALAVAALSISTTASHAQSIGANGATASTPVATDGAGNLVTGASTLTGLTFNNIGASEYTNITGSNLT